MKILITDDLYTNRLLAAIALRALGHTYDEAVHGDDAISKLRVNDYDMILMDIEMPVRNGLETTLFIRENFDVPKRDVKIVAITAHDPGELIDNFTVKGFNGFISKPVTKEKLLRFL
jgi:two-component system, response regulator, stage 0 sporulation protein F